jgi:hypothetical protein
MAMVITETQKRILKAISYDEQKSSTIAKKIGQDEDHIFDDIHELSGMGLVDSTDGFYYLTDAGIAVAASEGMEVPDEVLAAPSTEPIVTIGKRGEAAAKYRKGMGIEEVVPTGATAKYLEGVARRTARTTSKKEVIKGIYTDEEPEETVETQTQPRTVEAQSEGIIEGGMYHLRVGKINVVSCPLLGLVPVVFCLEQCKCLKTINGDEVVCTGG